ncbi:hypothetical protein [Mesorhizobium huakuii]|uniref:Uncharacterized protein n=1 Tax=Mesorhizobium huakuii TaxID=28104 RepID=A0A7G6STP2_9HYPH|nr:hypothetical protein [Mesorhizobium huakuii]QND57874.1 hypothetical protein HB778_15650 [Mesorhizobium huakuii]
MASDLRRRIEALESAQPIVEIVDASHSGRAQAFASFISETFDLGQGDSPATNAAKLYGLPSAPAFMKWVKAGFSQEAHAVLAQEAYGDDWRTRADEVAATATARCRVVHGNDWEQVLADRMASDNGHSRYPVEGISKETRT